MPQVQVPWEEHLEEQGSYLGLTEVQGVGSFCLRLCEEQVPKKETLSVVFLEGV